MFWSLNYKFVGVFSYQNLTHTHMPEHAFVNNQRFCAPHLLANPHTYTYTHPTLTHTMKHQNSQVFSPWLQLPPLPSLLQDLLVKTLCWIHLDEQSDPRTDVPLYVLSPGGFGEQWGDLRRHPGKHEVWLKIIIPSDYDDLPAVKLQCNDHLDEIPLKVLIIII